MHFILKSCLALLAYRKRVWVYLTSNSRTSKDGKRVRDHQPQYTRGDLLKETLFSCKNSQYPINTTSHGNQNVWMYKWVMVNEIPQGTWIQLAQASHVLVNLTSLNFITMEYKSLVRMLMLAITVSSALTAATANLDRVDPDINLLMYVDSWNFKFSFPD